MKLDDFTVFYKNICRINKLITYKKNIRVITIESFRISSPNNSVESGIRSINFRSSVTHPNIFRPIESFKYEMQELEYIFSMEWSSIRKYKRLLKEKK